MRPFHLLAVLSTAGLLTACNGMSNRPDSPVLGASRPPVAGPAGTSDMSGNVAMMNSDNRPENVRTGLNSDPHNPNGVARPNM